MKIAIIGAGFTGLSAAYYLQKKGHQVVVIEKEKNPGGLALGYKENGWEWTLEEHYHHWFTNDRSVLALANEIKHNVLVKRPKTSSFVENKIYQLDSPISLLRFIKLSFLERLRMGVALAMLRYNPFWKFLERYRAEPYLRKMMGSKGYIKIWEPLMVNKLGKYSKEVSLAWFWARVYKRTPNLAYPEGGFLEFAKHLEKEVTKLGGIFYYKTEVVEISSGITPKIKFRQIRNSKLKIRNYDAVVVTLPIMLFLKITPQLPKQYIDKYSKLISLGAMNLILRLKEPLLADGTYWLNICDVKSPILAIVEHTNFMDKKHYKNEHIVYLGNYLDTRDPRFKMKKEELLDLYDPLLKKINPNYQLSILNSQLFKAPFAQPIIPVDYSKIMPPFTTPLEHVYLANIQQVYPWDRGTNYAIELGEKIANLI